jgi:hypothetical protein
MTIALKPARQHDYRLSAYERKANDFYPTPSDLAISLALGLPWLGSICLKLRSIRVAVTARSAAAWRRLGSMCG